MTTKRITSLSIGNAELTIPEIDGEWVRKWSALRETSSIDAGDHTYSFDASSIIPKDGYKYLVEFRLFADPTTKDQPIICELGTTADPRGPVRMIANDSTIDWPMLVLDTDRMVYLRTRSNSYAGKLDLYINKYKRLAN